MLGLPKHLTRKLKKIHTTLLIYDMIILTIIKWQKRAEFIIKEVETNSPCLCAGYKVKTAYTFRIMFGHWQSNGG